MGNASSNKNKKQKYEEVETLLIESYKNTDLEFSFKEITSFKLRIHDAENYFHTKFDTFMYFNNYLFRERLSTLYDNFNNKIESFSASKPKPFLSVLIDFDDESDSISQGSKMDFDSLFTIVFEKLEISICLYFDMTNVDNNYIKDFFFQMIESVDLYKYNRKFDCLYYLLPNTDYFVKNDCMLLYITNKTLPNKKIFFNEDVADIKNEFVNSIFYHNDREKLLNSRYPLNEANNFFELFIENIKPTMVKLYLNINFITEIESFILANEEQFRLIDMLFQNCAIVNLSIDLYNINLFGNYFKHLEFFIKKILFLFEKSKLAESVLILRLITRQKYKSNINFEEFKFSGIKNQIKEFINECYYNGKNNKRKLNIEYIELTPTQNFVSSSHTPRSSYSSISLEETIKKQCTECYLHHEKLFFYWFLPNKTNSKLKDIQLCFGVLLNNDKFKKLKNEKILKNLKDMLFLNYYAKHSISNKQINIEEHKLEL